jgi:hypothetical protein
MEFHDRIATKMIGCGLVGRKRVARNRLVIDVLFLGGAVLPHQMNEKRILKGNPHSLAEVADLRDGRLEVREAFPNRTTNH